MITINYALPIYIRQTPDDYENEIIGECYIINSDDEHNYVFYQTQKSQYDIADFVLLSDAIEYCKLKIDSVYGHIITTNCK